MSTYKTKWGRSIAALMAAALVFTGLPGTEAQAAKKAKLSTKKLTVTVGKKKTIKIKNKAKKAKYTFKSKKASIAKVSKKGVVTGKKKGSTKITVTEKKGKKKRKLGVVTVKVNPVKKPVVTNAPAQPTAPVVAPSTNPTQPTKAPDGPGQQTPQPEESTQPSKIPATPPVKASKPPTPPPTEKPTPTVDPYVPQGEGWVELDLSKWSGDEGSYLETGEQFVLDDVELVTVPIPETPVIDTMGQKVEILIRGSLAEQSSGFRFWLANSSGATLSQQYYFTENSVGIGADSGSAEGFNLGKPFHVQATLEHTNHDGSEDMLATALLLKGPSYGTYLEGVTITGIWIRYGDKIGSSTEDPDKPGTETPNPDTPPVESGNVDTSSGEKPGGNKVDTDVELTKANSQAVGALAPSATGQASWGADEADENEDGSITFHSSATNSGGGRIFWFNKDKSDLDPSYTKVLVTLSSVQAALPLAIEARKNDTLVGETLYPSTDKQAGKSCTIEVPIDAAANGVMIKYNGWMQDDERTDEEKESTRADITVTSIKFAK